LQQSYGGKKVDLFGVLNICFGEHIVHELEGQTVRKPRSRLGTSPWPLRHGGCSSPSATGAVGLPGGGDPILLVYRPAAVRLLHAWLGHVHPTKPVGLADIHSWSTFCLMIAILPRFARAGTEMPRESLTRRMIVHSPSAMDFREYIFPDVG